MLFFLNSALIHSQKSFKISFHQDFKLLTFGDKLGNEAGTLDFITKIKYEGKDKKIGFFIFGAEFERANIKDGYSRYGGYIGFTLKPFINNIDVYITPSIGYGTIERRETNSGSWTSSMQIAYRILENIKISSLFQFTERTDLKIAHGKNEIRYSFFIGLEVNLFRFN